MKKKLFFSSLAFADLKILAFKHLFGIKCLFCNFWQRAHFGHNVTYHWKALKEYFPNIYGFMTQNLFLFELKSLIIYSIWCVNNETHFKYIKDEKLKFGIGVNNICRGLQFISRWKKTFFQLFSICWSQDIGI